MIGVGMKATFVPAFEPKVDWALTRSTDEVTGTITISTGRISSSWSSLIAAARSKENHLSSLRLVGRSN